MLWEGALKRVSSISDHRSQELPSGEIKTSRVIFRVTFVRVCIRGQLCICIQGVLLDLATVTVTGVKIKTIRVSLSTFLVTDWNKTPELSETFFEEPKYKLDSDP